MNKKHVKKIPCSALKCGSAKIENLKNILTCPFDENTASMHKLLSYFLYSAPGIESVHSYVIPREKHSAILSVMLDERHFCYTKFCSPSAQVEDELKKASLNGDELCLKCKRFVCKKKHSPKNKEKESDLDCFLRHIRNAIAHGRFYYRHDGNKVHILFEDINKSGNYSARIVCIKADLQEWKNILEHSTPH